MFQAYRPARRLFYLALAVVAGLGFQASGFGFRSSGLGPRTSDLRPPASGLRLRISTGLESALKSATREKAEPAANAAVANAAAAPPEPQSGPTLTTVSDTVYRADGTPAQGALVVSWPAFVTASGTAVAAGTDDVTLGTNGALNVGLVPNTGATPAGVYYTVVYQLDDGTVKTQYWLVPTSSPATLAQVITTPGSGTAAQPVSMQYVNSELATKANDDAVVHLAGTETVTGTKSFLTPPNVPTPVNAGDVANKSYVDNAAGNVGAGNYLPTAGGTLTGPLTLSGNPSAPLQAAAKQYVDSSVAAKADLVSGLVPTAELGNGTATSSSCLLGNGTWGACGSSANAIEIQGVAVAATAPANGQVLSYSSSSGQYSPVTPSGASGGVVTAPTASQNIAQPAGTQLSVNNLSGIRYVTPGDNWSVAPSGTLFGGTQATVTLTPCPVGVDATGNSMYYVYLSGQGTPEPAMVTGGTCTAGASSGTIIFTPRNAHAAGYTLSSASSGIQEAINDACGVPNGSGGNPNAHVVLPATGANANALPVYGSIYAHCSRALIEGNGTMLSCATRDRCMVLGDLVNSNHYGGVTVRGIRFGSSITQDGCQITNTQRQSNVVTITVGAGCSTMQTGDLVNINFTDNTAYWGSHGPVTVSGTAITYNQTAGNLAAAATPGTIAIQNAALEDNALPGIMEQVQLTSAAGGAFNQGLVIDNDQAATIRNTDYNGGLLCTANHCGSYVYSAGTTAATPVIWIDKANWSFQCAGNGITNLANNSTHITDSVIQGFGMWGVNTTTILGSYGGTQIDNVYNEEGSGPCPHPYFGNAFSSAGIIYFSGTEPLIVRGGEQPNGWMPVFANTGTTAYNYYVVIHDSAEGVSYPLYAGYAMSNGSGNITVQWPHVAPVGTVTYDVLRMSPGSLAGNSPVFPVQGACTGGSTTGCGSVATGVAQCSGLVCTYTDSAAITTTNYTIPTPTYFPSLYFWPGGMILNGYEGQNAGVVSSAFVDNDGGSVNSSAWISTAGFLRPTIFARQCSSGAPVPYGGAWIQCLEGDSHGNGFPQVGALLLNNGPNAGDSAGNVKGRLNFEFAPGDALNSQHIITLVDSNPAKTLATALYRPPNDANDTWVGLDNGNVATSQAQLAFGAPKAISLYIGNTGDNSSYKERLTAAGKTFNLPVTVNGNLTVAGASNVTLPITGSGSQCLHVSATGVVSGTGSDCGSGGGAMTNPMTSFNDMVVGGSGGTATRLAAVSNSILTTNSAGVQTWAAAIPESQVTNLSSDLATAKVNNTVWVDGGTGTGHFSTLCAGLAYAAAHNVSTIWDSAPENGASAWTKDPFNDASCGNGYTGFTLYRSAGTWMTQAPVVQPGGVTVIDGGRGSELQVSSANTVAGTLTIACQSASPYSGAFAMNCPGGTNFPGAFIASISRNGTTGVVTVTTSAAHHYTAAMATAGVPIVINLVTGGTTSFDGNFTLCGAATTGCSNPTSTVLTYQQAGATESGTASGASTVGSAVWSLAQARSSFNTRLSNSTISAAGITGSLCAQNIWSQERSLLDAVTCSGAQVLGVDWEGSWAQNSRLEDVEVIGGSQTTTTIGLPTTFSCFKISVNGPAGSYRDLHCNPRGTATTTPINAAMVVTGTQGGHISTFHFENSNYGIVVDGAGSVHSNGLRIDGLNTASTSQDGSTPTAMVKICAAGSGAPCTSGTASSNVSIGPLVAIAPNLTANCIVDDTANGGAGLAIASANCPTEYESGTLEAGGLTVNGNLTVTGTCTGCGGSGSGTVNSATASQMAVYAANGTTVSGDSALTDNGATLSYTGSGGISAEAGTFSGNVTVNGQLLVAGPWTVSSPIPGTAMAPAAAGTSALGISNDGNFYISANAGTPQKVATTATSSYFTNLFQEDANDLGEYNGTTAQNLHVYSSYTNSSTWQRTSVGYDATDNYAVVRSENATSGTAPGLGFWINSGLKWVIDASSNFKPWTDQSYNIGSFNASSGTGLRPGTIYVAGNSTSASGFELGKFANESYELCNDTTNGTIVNGLALLTTAGCAAKPGSALTGGAIGVVIANAGTSGTGTLARTGSAFCSFDGTATVVGDYVVPSGTASSGFYPLCHDAGATRPTGTQILGRVLQASSGSATVQMFLDMPGSNVSSAASAGTGGCTNQAVTAVNSGAPTCSTITSAYTDSSIPSTSTLVGGNYTKASGASAVADSGVAAGPYATEWITAYRAGTATAFNITGTKILLWGVTLQFPLNTSTLSYNVSGADTTSNTYDLGIYNNAGTLVAHTGAIAGSTAMTAGAHGVSWSGTNPKTLQPGKYYLAITTSCTSSCATLSGDGSSAVVTFLSAGTVTTGGTQGTLDGSITAPADSYTWSGSMISFIVR